MERLEYDQTPDNKFFLCRSCHNHIALAKYSICGAVHLSVFEKAVNVLIDGPANYKRIGNSTVADVFCRKCKRLLGGKCVEVEKPLGAIREGPIFILLKELLFWNGYEAVLAITTTEPPRTESSTKSV